MIVIVVHDKSLLKYADVALEIPMRGKKESLNVASAMAVAVYQLFHTPKH